MEEKVGEGVSRIVFSQHGGGGVSRNSYSVKGVGRGGGVCSCTIKSVMHINCISLHSTFYLTFIVKRMLKMLL